MHSARATPTPGKAINSRARSALEFMRAHCAEQFTLAQVADRVGLTSSRLRHLLREQTGAPFRVHLMEFRLRIAEILLGDCKQRVSQIAYGCGYESVASFSREFKRRFGMCPSRYRRAKFSRPPKTPSKIAA
jgi:AraC-like DNA-binding protein